MDNPSPVFNLDAAIEALSLQQSKLAWLRRGRFLLEAKNSHEWPTRGEGTLTRTVQKIADAQGVHIGVLWREIKAAGYLDELRAKLAKEDIAVPPDQELPAGVNSEVLDILERIERVVPYEEFLKQAKIVIQGDMQRAKFRAYWTAVKPALGGRDARGRGEAPSVKDREQAKHSEHMMLAGLVEAGPRWLEKDGAICGYGLILEQSTLRAAKAACSGYIPDAIAVVQPTSAPQVELHGVEITQTTCLTRAPNFVKGLPAFDRFWLIAPVEPDPAWFARHNIPTSIGVIVADNNRDTSSASPDDPKPSIFKIHRHADRLHSEDNTFATTQRMRLLETLIAQKIKHF